ncbi:hypothetical protein A3A67_02255 [Candidatus Peribacteria bacterium RIFCSPLOWO2_01_FULL_51_18]|nr:MAG: hypothetical protein A3C52_01820 [Candidatus Peribacteria bacterium RIFCSPHIGHO2_02_FULL_51_15]OGJ66403.1 MAG: hypothetical protein A3A67_02255 [Candidatus Peribacteria bacterium RIFCSPLOWO2_01_FULL_51_18]OGJ69461.1 MAG: hypothetical protein A3J34_03275 [Candidatus Peribacteria bacterium RIFCSPLOWO2_02_FULL_51_10]
MSFRKKVLILGIPIDALTGAEAVDEVFRLIDSGSQHHIMTPNPEMLVEARRNTAFRTVLNETSMNVPDGTGLKWAAGFYGKPIPERVTGVDLLTGICSKENIPPVFLLGAMPAVAGSAAEKLKQLNPGLKVAGTYSGSPAAGDENDLINRINLSGARVLFVAFGAPAQDLWISRNLKKMPSVVLAMGVGGSFDFLAGTRRRAPACMRSAGLEWLWRLINEPRRFKRIFTAVVVFPLLVLRARARGE